MESVMKHVSGAGIAFAAIILTACLPASAGEEVNVYSYRQPGLIQPMLEAFTADTGIVVNVSYLDAGVIKRLQLEGRRSPADLILTTDISRLHAAVEGGVTQPVDSELINAAIPDIYRDADGHWFALTLRARVVYASRDRVHTDDLTSYEQLAGPEWHGRICSRSGTHAYNLSLIAAHIAHHGADDTSTWLLGIKNNLARRPQGNDRAQVKAIWAGECDISIGNTYYMGLMLDDAEQKAWAGSVRILFPRFEDGGTHMNVAGMAMVRHAPNHENALKLMEFLVSGRAQEIYAEINHEYPVNPAAALSETVASWGAFRHDSLSLDEIARLRPKALQLVEQTDFDR